MGVATTFGVVSTGTSNFKFDRCCSKYAALAWLGGGSVAAGGGGVAAGNAFWHWLVLSVGELQALC